LQAPPDRDLSFLPPYDAVEFSTCPPNSNRIEDVSLSANSASPRELKREQSAVLSTGVGTFASIAALIVHRPSPESETLPPNSASVGSFVREVAVKSSKQ
jgi:hypothetical protein